MGLHDYAVVVYRHHGLLRYQVLSWYEYDHQAALANGASCVWKVVAVPGVEEAIAAVIETAALTITTNRVYLIHPAVPLVHVGKKIMSKKGKFNFTKKPENG